MAVSAYLINKIMLATFENTSFSIASTYLQLHTGAPGSAGTSNVAGNNTRKLTSWSTPSSGTTSNDIVITWLSVSTTETYSHITLWDASTSGNLLWVGSFASPTSIDSGETFVLDIGDVTVGLS